jgi:hypothetical protein
MKRPLRIANAARCSYTISWREIWNPPSIFFDCHLAIFVVTYCDPKVQA